MTNDHVNHGDNDDDNYVDHDDNDDDNHDDNHDVFVNLPLQQVIFSDSVCRDCGEKVGTETLSEPTIRWLKFNSNIV